MSRTAPTTGPSTTPRRRLVRRFGLIILAALAVGLVALIVQAVRIIRAPAGSPGKYAREIAALVAPYAEGAPGEKADAVEVLREATALRRKVEAAVWAARGKAGQPAFNFDLIYSADQQTVGEPQDRELAVEALDEMLAAGLHDKLQAIVGIRRALVSTPDGPVFQFLLPELGQYRALARISGARLRLAAEAGKGDDVVRSFEQMLALGRVAATGFTIIQQLVGVAIHSLAFNRFMEDLPLVTLSEGQLRQALAALDRQALPPMALALQGERYGVLDLIETCHSDNGAGDGLLHIDALDTAAGAGARGGLALPSGLSKLVGVVMASKKQSVLRANELYDGLIRVAGAPRPERQRTFDTNAWMARLPRRFLLLHRIVPDVTRSLQSRDQSEMSREGVRIMLALEIHRLRRQAYPEALAELVPAILSEAPVDAVSGKAFGYRRFSAGEDPSGRGYLLYSLGDDGVDNQGVEPVLKPREDRPWSVLRPAGGGEGQSRGYDFVLNPPPKPVSKPD